ncbi:MAG: tyrosine--tRNA ligase [Salibacteraceae bacterium]
MNFVEELSWRGMIHSIMPGTEAELEKGMVTGYAGFDPTADSLHIGNLVPIMMLVFLQRSGHKPIALVGGATGMVGDPSGKSAERKLLDEETLNHILACQRKQLEQFLDFSDAPNAAEIVNNYDWFKNLSFLDFIRDVGKHITVNYMMAKDSVQNRLEAGLSFTEFSYQLVQGYDFYWLYENKNCKLQVGGSDQWGNSVTGTELVRRKAQGSAFAVTCPLITKADGTKFGKSEGGNIWLDKESTSPFKFYQYWLQSTDEDIVNYTRIFSLKSREAIEALEAQHAESPGMRLLQKELGKELTIRVHSEADFDRALEASEILFGKGTAEALARLPEADLLTIFAGVDQGEIQKADIDAGIPILELLAGKTNFLPSTSEGRRALKENSISINKVKVTPDLVVTSENLIAGRYLVLQRGKKKKFFVKVV